MITAYPVLLWGLASILSITILCSQLIQELLQTLHSQSLFTNAVKIAKHVSMTTQPEQQVIFAFSVSQDFSYYQRQTVRLAVEMGLLQEMRLVMMAQMMESDVP